MDWSHYECVKNLENRNGLFLHTSEPKFGQIWYGFGESSPHNSNVSSNVRILSSIVHCWLLVDDGPDRCFELRTGVT